MNIHRLFVDIEIKCKQQISGRKLKYEYKFTYTPNQGKLNNLNLVTSIFFRSVVEICGMT